MKTKTVTVNEGERLGPVDWSYDFARQGWTPGREAPGPAFYCREVEMLRQLETWLRDGKRCEVLMYSMWEPVLDTGMWDGWPYWKPTPSFYSTTWLGGSWHCFTSICAVRLVEESA